MPYIYSDITDEYPQCPEHDVALSQETYLRGNQMIIAGWRCPADDKLWEVDQEEGEEFAIDRFRL